MTGFRRRWLPPAEWCRLAGTALGDVATILPVDRTRVVAVETADGALVGCWAFLPQLHAEGVWRHPALRFGEQRRVVQLLLEALHEAGADWPTVVTGASTAPVQDLLRRLGATPIPVDQYVLPLPCGPAPRQTGVVQCQPVS